MKLYWNLKKTWPYLITLFFSMLFGLEISFEKQFFSNENVYIFLVFLTPILLVSQLVIWYRKACLERYFWINVLGLIFIICTNTYYSVLVYYSFFVRQLGFSWKEEWAYEALLLAILSVFGFFIQLLIYLFVGGKKLWRHYLNFIESHDQRQ